MLDYKKANDLIKSKSIFRRDDAVCFSNLANAEVGKEQWADALRDFEYAAQLDRGYAAPVIGRALVLYQLGRDQDSLLALEKLSEQYPEFADSKAALAVLKYDAGEVVVARTLLQDALDGDGRYRDVDWVRDIRRWTPRLVRSLGRMLADRSFDDITPSSDDDSTDE